MAFSLIKYSCEENPVIQKNYNPGSAGSSGEQKKIKYTQMKAILSLLSAALLATTNFYGQTEPSAGKWKTWFITSGKDYRLPAPSSYQTEIGEVISRQSKLDSATRHHINYWNGGAPGYR